MKKFFLFEIKHWLKQPMTWIFLGIYVLISFFFFYSDNISIGDGGANVRKNAPLVVQSAYAYFSVILGVIISTAFFNATATRDYTYGMDQIVFASPIKKSHLFFGKFAGVFLIALIPYLGIAIGALAAPFMPGADPERYGAFSVPAHLYGFLLFSFFNTLFSGGIIYSFALYFRNPVIAYLSSFGLIILYSISSSFTADIENETLAMFTDPMGLNAFDIYTKYWTPAQRNAGFIRFEGNFLLSRLLWAGISMMILFLVYRLFDFTRSRDAGKKKKNVTEGPAHVYQEVPVMIVISRPVASWHRQFLFELKSIVKNNSFIILSAIGLVLLVVNLVEGTGNYGIRNLPVTYNIAGVINNSMSLFIRGFIIFYSGYIVFREREVKFNEIVDATRMKSIYIVTSKIAAIIASVGLVMVLAVVFGIVAQISRGYYHIELLLYAKFFCINLLSCSFIVVISYLLQTLINNKYIAYFAIVVFLIANIFLWQSLQIESNMVQYGSLPSIIYSDMNGFGPFIPGSLAFGLYWALFAGLLILIIIGMHLRGKEIGFKNRGKQLGIYLKQHVALTAVLLAAFLVCGGWLYYNTEVKNTYISSKEVELRQVSYEQKYKQYEKMDLPFTTALEYNIDIFPAKRDMHASVKWWVKNVHPRPVTALHFNIPEKATNIQFIIPNSVLISEDKLLKYNIYNLTKPLLPNDSIQLSFTADYINNGIENEVSFTQLTQNGTFFHDHDILPVPGYVAGNEIADKNDRRKYKLPVKERMPKLTRNCASDCNTSYISNSADWVSIKTTISTDSAQTAIAPGSLTKEWRQNGRRYFTYELKHEALNFFSFISAEYLVKRDTVNGIDVEVYYDKKHPYNTDRMVTAVKNALRYYTEHFGPYYNQQCRIIEYPRYQSYAQAFPGTMPYSEGIGYINDLRDPKALDMVTYVVAHEMGHQWWAHQVIGPEMQGSEMFSEGLAQYSALMVMEQMYGKEQINRFLKYELDNYLRGRTSERDYENPLMFTENQQYIHYNKASLVFYYLKEMIGEQQLNSALKTIVHKYAYTQPPFPTAFNIVDELKAVTPDSLQYLITDMFETITLFNNKVEQVKVTQGKDKLYKVEMTVNCEKIKSDSLGNERPVAVNDYIDVGIFGENREHNNDPGRPILYKRIKITGQRTTLNFTVAQKPYLVGIDPYHYLIDKVISDNLKKAE